jgi:hypothetical protein
MIGVLGMGRIAQILGAVRHPMPTGLGDDEREPEQPVSFAPRSRRPRHSWTSAGYRTDAGRMTRASPGPAIFCRLTKDRFFHRAF